MSLFGSQQVISSGPELCEGLTAEAVCVTEGTGCARCAGPTESLQRPTTVRSCSRVGESKLPTRCPTRTRGWARSLLHKCGLQLHIMWSLTCFRFVLCVFPCRGARSWLCSCTVTLSAPRFMSRSTLWSVQHVTYLYCNMVITLEMNISSYTH